MTERPYEEFDRLYDRILSKKTPTQLRREYDNLCRYHVDPPSYEEWLESRKPTQTEETGEG